MPENTQLPIPAHSGSQNGRVFDYHELAAERKIPLKDYWRILRRRKRLVAGFFLGAIILTGLVCLFMTPVYRGASLLQITQDNPVSQVNENEILAMIKGQEANKFQETQYKILSSRSLAWRVIELLNLPDHKEFAFLKEKYQQEPPEKQKDETLDLFLKKLSITPVKDSFLVEVVFKSEDPQLAKQVTNSMAREYMQLSIDRRSDSFVLVKEWLERQLSQLAEKVQGTQKKLFEFGQKADFFALEDKDNVIVQKYIELSNLITKAQSERMAKEANYQQINEKGPDAPLITNNPLILNLRQELVGQDAKVASMRKVFLPGHPEMQVEKAKLQEMRGRLGAEVKRLQESVKADYEAAVRAESLLTAAFSAQKGQMVELQKNLVDFQILKRDAQTTEKLYQALLARMGEATVASTMVPSNVTIIDPADLPVEPYLPRPGLFLGLAGVLGLFLGVGAAFAAEYLDDSLKTAEDVERMCPVPYLGQVPHSARVGEFYDLRLQAKRGPRCLTSGNRTPLTDEDIALMVFKNPGALMSEAIRHLRTSIALSTPGGPPAAVLITSPNPGEGKSTIAANLAISLAIEGRRVALMDCDLRRPMQHQIFQQPSHPGLTNFLAGDAGKEQIMQSTMVPNLSLIPAGAQSPNPAELLGSEAFREFLQELRRDFQHLIIDSPPIIGFADARIISPLVDGVLLTVKQSATPRESGRLACQLLTQGHSRLLGLIMNQAKLNGHAPYYYNYYKYYHNGGIKKGRLEQWKTFLGIK